MPQNQELQAVLEAARAEDIVKADAWDHFLAVRTPEEFRSKFDGLALPRETKRELWFLKFPESRKLPPASAPSPAQLPPAQVAAAAQHPVATPAAPATAVPPIPSPESMGLPGPAKPSDAHMQPLPALPTISGNIAQFLGASGEAHIAGERGEALTPEQQERIGEAGGRPLIPITSYVGDKGFGAGVAQHVEEFTSPTAIAAIPAVAGAQAIPGVNVALNAFMTYAASKSAAESVQRAYKAHQAGDDETAAHELGYGSVDALMAVLFGTQAARGGKDTVGKIGKPGRSGGGSGKPPKDPGGKTIDLEQTAPGEYGGPSPNAPPPSPDFAARQALTDELLAGFLKRAEPGKPPAPSAKAPVETTPPPASPSGGGGGGAAPAPKEPPGPSTPGEFTEPVTSAQGPREVQTLVKTTEPPGAPPPGQTGTKSILDDMAVGPKKGTEPPPGAGTTEPPAPPKLEEMPVGKPPARFRDLKPSQQRLIAEAVLRDAGEAVDGAAKGQRVKDLIAMEEDGDEIMGPMREGKWGSSTQKAIQVVDTAPVMPEKKPEPAAQASTVPAAKEEPAVPEEVKAIGDLVEQVAAQPQPAIAETKDVSTETSAPVTETKTPEPETKSTPVETASTAVETGEAPKGVIELPTEQITADPVRFQFKRGTGAGGAGEELKGVKKFDKELAGVVAVWKDPADGKTYIVNGHHRLDLAKRLGEPSLTVRYLTAPTAEEARAKGALINIAEGRGDAVDAAKLFRDTGMTAEDLDKSGISLKGAVARDGLNLAKLSPKLFTMVSQGDMPIKRAAILGEMLPSHEDQEMALAYVEKSGRRLTDDEFREVLRRVSSAAKIKEIPGDKQQVKLFEEDEQEVERSLFAEEAMISNYVRDKLGKEKKLFGTVSRTGAAKELEKGGNVIDTEQSQAISKAAAAVLEVYDKLSVMSGPIAQAITDGAKELAAGGKEADVKERTYTRIRDAVSETLGGKKAGVPKRDEGTDPDAGSSAAPSGQRDQPVAPAEPKQAKEPEVKSDAAPSPAASADREPQLSDQLPEEIPENEPESLDYKDKGGRNKVKVISWKSGDGGFEANIDGEVGGLMGGSLAFGHAGGTRAEAVTKAAKAAAAKLKREVVDRRDSVTSDAHRKAAEKMVKWLEDLATPKTTPPPGATAPSAPSKEEPKQAVSTTPPPGARPTEEDLNAIKRAAGKAGRKLYEDRHTQEDRDEAARILEEIKGKDPSAYRTDAERNNFLLAIDNLETAIESAAKKPPAPKPLAPGDSALYNAPNGEKIPVTVVSTDRPGAITVRNAQGSEREFDAKYVERAPATPPPAPAAPAEPKTRPYSSTQVNLPAPLADKVRAEAAKIAEEDLDPEEGREDEIHATVKFGILQNDPEAIRDLIGNEPPVRVKLGKVSLFENEKHDVVKFEVDSEDLKRLNAKIRENIPGVDTHPEYKPHVTLAYVKPGTGKKYTGENPLTGTEFLIDEVVFSGADGTKHVIKLKGARQTAPPPEPSDNTGGKKDAPDKPATGSVQTSPPPGAEPRPATGGSPQPRGATGQRVDERPSSQGQPASESGPVDASGSGRLGEPVSPGASAAGQSGTAPAKSGSEVKKPRIITVGNPPKVDVSNIPRPKKFKLYEHQEQAIGQAIEAMGKDDRGFLNAGGTGSGKTAAASAVARYWLDQNKPVLLVGPAEVFKFESTDSAMPRSSYKDWIREYDLEPIRYKAGMKMEPGKFYISTYNEYAKVKEDDIPSDLVMIADEAHAFKNAMESQRGKVGLVGTAKAHAVMFMTATPADKPQHIEYLQRIGMFEGTDEETALRKLGMLKVERENKKTGETVIKWMVDPRVGTSQVRRNFLDLFSRMIEKGKMRKEEIALDNMDIRVEETELPAEAQEVADLIQRELAGKTDTKNIMMHLRRQQEPFKIPATIEAAKKELAEGRKVVIFVNRVNESRVVWREKIRDPYSGEVVDEIEHEVYRSEGTAKTLKAELEKAGITKIAEIHGGADYESAEGMRRFQENEADIVIATAPSGGTGIDLDDKAGDAPRTILVMTPEFDAMNNVQLMGRIYRMSTRSDARVRYLFANTDIDRWNASKLSSKIKTLSSVVQGESGKMDVGEFFETDIDEPAEQPKPGVVDGRVVRKKKRGEKLKPIKGSQYGDYIEFFESAAEDLVKIFPDLQITRISFGKPVAGFHVDELEQREQKLYEAGYQLKHKKMRDQQMKYRDRLALPAQAQSAAAPASSGQPLPSTAPPPGVPVSAAPPVTAPPPSPPSKIVLDSITYGKGKTSRDIGTNLLRPDVEAVYFEYGKQSGVVEFFRNNPKKVIVELIDTGKTATATLFDRTENSLKGAIEAALRNLK